MARSDEQEHHCSSSSSRFVLPPSRATSRVRLLHSNMIFAFFRRHSSSLAPLSLDGGCSLAIAQA